MREGLTKLNKKERSSYIVLTHRQGTGSREEGGWQLPASHDTTSQSVHSKSGGLSLNQGYILLWGGGDIRKNL